MTLGKSEDKETVGSFISIKKVAIFVILGVLVYLAIILYSQIDSISAAISLLPWWVLPAMMGLSFLNYIIRYVKWQYYLRRIGINLNHSDSFSIFLAGFTLTATPGKIGEGIKGVFINDINNAPLAKTVPVVVSERVTDLLAMVILAMFGFMIGFAATDQLYLVALVGVVALVGALILGHSAFYQKVLSKMTSFGPLKRFKESSNLIEETMTSTLSPKPMALSTLVSVPGWFMECMELWLLLSILTGAGLPSLTYSSLVLLLQATFIHATASAVGALSFLPGGLVGYEVSAVALMQLLMGLTSGVAGAATIIIRVVTLWFSVIVGFAALGIVLRRASKRG